MNLAKMRIKICLAMSNGSGWSRNYLNLLTFELLQPIMVLSDIHGFESWRMLPRERQRFYELLDTTAAGGFDCIR